MGAGVPNWRTPAAVQAEEGVLHDVFGGGLVAGHQDGELYQGQGVRLV
jgi:hypothetical protein